jgi:hypothetical protein
LGPGRVKNFLISTSSGPALGSTQTPIQWVPVALSPGIKRPECEADHSPPASDEDKKMWINTSTPIRLHDVMLNSLTTGTTFIPNSPTVLLYITQIVDKRSRNKPRAEQHIIFEKSVRTTHIVTYRLTKKKTCVRSL